MPPSQPQAAVEPQESHAAKRRRQPQYNLGDEVQLLDLHLDPYSGRKTPAGLVCKVVARDISARHAFVYTLEHKDYDIIRGVPEIILEGMEEWDLEDGSEMEKFAESAQSDQSINKPTPSGTLD